MAESQKSQNDDSSNMTQNKYVRDKCFHFKMKAKHKEPDEH